MILSDPISSFGTAFTRRRNQTHVFGEVHYFTIYKEPKMSLQTFYAGEQLCDPFGDMTPPRTKARRGSDVAGHPVREPVPAWLKGEVVTSK